MPNQCLLRLSLDPRRRDMTEPSESLLAMIVGLVVILFIGTAVHGGLARACRRQLARCTQWRLDRKRSVIAAKPIMASLHTAIVISLYTGDNVVQAACTALDAGGAIDEVDSEGWQPIHRAIMHANDQSKELVRWLHSKGAALDACHTQNRTSVMHVACANGNLDLAVWLHESGALLDPQDANGWLPLHVASHNGQLDVVTWLVGLGADISASVKVAPRGVEPARAIDLARVKGHTKVIEWLAEQEPAMNKAMASVRTLSARLAGALPVLMAASDIETSEILAARNTAVTAAKCLGALAVKAMDYEFKAALGRSGAIDALTKAIPAIPTAACAALESFVENFHLPNRLLAVEGVIAGCEALFGRDMPLPLVGPAVDVLFLTLCIPDSRRHMVGQDSDQEMTMLGRALPAERARSLFRLLDPRVLKSALRTPHGDPNFRNCSGGPPAILELLARNLSAAKGPCALPPARLASEALSLYGWLLDLLRLRSFEPLPSCSSPILHAPDLRPLAEQPGTDIMTIIQIRAMNRGLYYYLAHTHLCSLLPEGSEELQASVAAALEQLPHFSELQASIGKAKVGRSIDQYCDEIGRSERENQDMLQVMHRMELKKMRQEAREGSVGAAVMAAAARHCGACNKRIDRGSKMCDRCESISYCSSTCQHNHWPEHKLVCKRLKKKAESVANCPNSLRDPI